MYQRLLILIKGYHTTNGRISLALGAYITHHQNYSKETALTLKCTPGRRDCEYSLA